MPGERWLEEEEEEEKEEKEEEVAVWRGHRVESTALPASTRILWTYQAILIVSSGCKPADLIILGVPGPRRNERAMAFPGVDSIIGSNSGLACAVLRYGQLRKTRILSRAREVLILPISFFRHWNNSCTEN